MLQLQVTRGLKLVTLTVSANAIRILIPLTTVQPPNPSSNFRSNLLLTYSVTDYSLSVTQCRSISHCVCVSH